jgi:aspartate aminotransferase-like enzyme
MDKHHLRIPGPTEVPEEVLAAMQRPMLSHRGEEFAAIFKDVSEGMKYVFQTKNDVLMFPAAGTGVMEAAIVNLFSPQDRILAFPNGVFSERFVKIAEAFGASVERVPVEWGKSVTPDIVRERILQDKHHEIKGILFTQNETSTGVLNDIKSLRKAVGDHPALVVVDAVSSLGAVDLKTDDWGLDAVVAGSQKALMIPPGLGFVCINEKAMHAVESSKMPRFYWDFKSAKKRLDKWQTPYTPAVSLIFAMKKSLEIIKSEGLENIFTRHEVISKALREGIKAIGLKLFADELHASPTVTSVDISNIDVNLSKLLKSEFNITVAGGQDKLKSKIIRIGHLGYLDRLDIIEVLAALEMLLGNENNYGEGIKAAEKIFNKERD